MPTASSASRTRSGGSPVYGAGRSEGTRDFTSGVDSDTGVMARICYRRAFHATGAAGMTMPVIASERIAQQWDGDIVPRLVEYVRIPAKSPHFDPAWEAHGYLDQVVRLAEGWVRAQPVRRREVEIVRIPGRTPLLLFATGGVGDRTVDRKSVV